MPVPLCEKYCRTDRDGRRHDEGDTPQAGAEFNWSDHSNRTGGTPRRVDCDWRTPLSSGGGAANDWQHASRRSATVSKPTWRRRKKNAEKGAGADTEAVETQQRDDIVTVLQQRIRYLLTLKGRPPFRLAGIEMYDRLSEVNACIQSM